VLLLVLGRVVYGVALPSTTMPAAVLSILVGAVSFSYLGFAFTLLIRDARSAVAMITGVNLTLFFISGSFFPVDKAPRVFRTVADTFPVRHFNEAVLTAFNPNVRGAGFQWWDLIVVALWGLAALVVAMRFFRWNPTGD
jgi:ABC-2 type transport system permease protein